MGPTVSIIMPVYNCRAYLDDAVESVLNQTFRDFEFIVVDDGSTDGSCERLADWRQRDPRLRLLMRSHVGVTRALNDALSHARGTFVGRMDADDVADANRIEKQVRFLQRHPEVVAVGTGLRLIDAEGIPVGEARPPLSHEEIDAAHLRGEGGLAHPTVLMRRGDLVALGGYREKFPVAQDKDLWLRLAERGRLANLPELLLQYRLRPDSVSFDRCDAQTLAARRAVEDASQRRGLKKRAEFIAPRADSAIVNTQMYAERLAYTALAGRHYAAARKHAARSLVQSPWTLKSWCLLFGALLGPSGRVIAECCRDFYAWRP